MLLQGKVSGVLTVRFRCPHSLASSPQQDHVGRGGLGFSRSSRKEMPLPVDKDSLRIMLVVASCMERH